MRPELLKILCCPETHQPLSPADPAIVRSVNEKIAAGTVSNRGGSVIREAVTDGLVRADGKVLYPIRGTLPILLIDEAIPLPI